jgi:hypothetical protein
MTTHIAIRRLATCSKNQVRLSEDLVFNLAHCGEYRCADGNAQHINPAIPETRAITDLSGSHG